MPFLNRSFQRLSSSLPFQASNLKSFLVFFCLLFFCFLSSLKLEYLYKNITEYSTESPDWMAEIIYWKKQTEKKQKKTIPSSNLLKRMRSVPKGLSSHIYTNSFNELHGLHPRTEGGRDILSFLHKPKCINVLTMPADFSETAFQIYSLLYSLLLH